MQSWARLTLLAILASAVHASAENRVCIGGDLDHMTTAQKAGCQNSAAQVRTGVGKFNAPADWHFFVLCTEADWKTYAAFSKKTPEELALSDADTDIQTRSTFFRADRLNTATVAGLDRILAHEVASALAETTDETVIRKQLALLLPEPPKADLTLQASR